MKTLRSRYIRRVLVPVMAVSLLSACGKWTLQEMAPSEVVSEKEPGRVRLTMLDGDRMELGDPIVSGGEILGHPMRSAGGRYRADRSYTLRVAADSVARIEIRETDTLATVIAVTLGLAFAAVVAVVAFNQAWEDVWEDVEVFPSGGFRPTGGR